jgi:hypothetical protein
MQITQNRKELELRRDRGMGLADLVAGLRVAARQGWRPWCDDCSGPSRYVSVRLVQTRAYIAVNCSNHHHRELVEPEVIHGATVIHILPLSFARACIVSPSWKGFSRSLWPDEIIEGIPLLTPDVAEALKPPTVAPVPVSIVRYRKAG